MVLREQRERVWYVELDLPICSLVYGTAPCTASIPTTGLKKCFNSRKTCQDSANYTPTFVTLRWGEDNGLLPTDIECTPLIVRNGVRITPSLINLGKGLGQRATVTVTMQDAPHGDVGPGYDKYQADRDNPNAFSFGSYWGRFRARHPFIRKAPMRIYRGFVGQTLSEMDIFYYFVENFDGPRQDGTYTLVGTDLLKYFDGDRAKVPNLTYGFLDEAIDDTVTEARLSPPGIGASLYDASGKINLGASEVVSYTRKYDIDLLYHFDGTNGATTGINNENTETTATANFTVNNGCALSTTQKKFGTASLFADGSNDYATCGAGAAAVWAFGTKDFNVNFWWWPVAFGGGAATIIDTRVTNTPDFGLAVVMTAAGLVEVLYNNTVILQSGALTLGAFNHICISRVNGTLRIFIGGAITGALNTVAFASNITCVANGPRLFARYNNFAGTFANGYMDELAVTVGEGVDSAFTPPTTPYTLTRGDKLSIVRAQDGTEAVAHDAGERAQICKIWTGETIANIAYDIAVNHSGIDPSYIDKDQWDSEVATYIPNLFSTIIPEATSAKDLINDLFEQAGASLYYNEQTQKIYLIALRAISADSLLLDESNMLSFVSKENPNNRYTQVWVFYDIRNILDSLNNVDNFRSIATIVDLEAEENYGGKSVKEIYSRFIPTGGQATAERTGEIILSRYVNPPRTFDIELKANYEAVLPQLANGYNINHRTLQDDEGYEIAVPSQVIAINYGASRDKVTLEEVIFSAPATDLNARKLTFNADLLNVDLLAVHNLNYPEPESGDTWTLDVVIEPSAHIGSSLTTLPAFDVGENADWPAGVDITITIRGIIQGAGAASVLGGVQSPFLNPGQAGKPGGTALYTRKAITIVWDGGSIKGGGGSGAGGQGFTDAPGSPSGSGAGFVPGGVDASPTAGGPSQGFGVYQSGAGGDPGQPGNGAPGPTPGGAAGNAIDGASHVTDSGTPNTIGPTVN